MHRTAYLLLLLTTLFWGGNAVAGKLAVGHVSPMVLTAMRWGLAGLIVAIVSHRQLRADWPAIRPSLPLLMLLGAVGFTVFSVALYAALLYTTAINVSIAQGGMPLFVFAASFVLFRNRVSRLQVAGFALSFLGVMVTATHGQIGRLMSLDVNFGDALMLVAIVAYGFYTAALRLKPQTHWTSLMIVLCAAAFLSAIPFVVAEAAAGAAIFPDTTGWLVLGFVVVFPSLLAQIFYIRAVELIGANRAGLFINLLPIWGALLAVMVVNEDFQVYHGVALVLVLTGILIAEYSGRKSEGR